MSVQVATWLILGIKIPYQDYDYPEFEKYDKLDILLSNSYPKKRKWGLLWDGMNGKYILAGKVLAAGDSMDGIELTEINQPSIIEYKEVINWLKEYDIDSEQKLPIKLYLVTHYS